MAAKVYPRPALNGHGLRPGRHQPPKRKATTYREPMPIDPLKYDKMVMKIAVKYGASARHVRDSDQYTLGWEGLLKAVQKFRPELGYRFCTYAWSYIEGYCERTRRPTRKYAPLFVPQFSQLGDFNLDEQAELADDGEPIGEALERQELCERAMSALRPRQARIVRAWYMEGLTMKATGKRFGLTRQRAQQVIDESLATMRRLLRESA